MPISSTHVISLLPASSRHLISLLPISNRQFKKKVVYCLDQIDNLKKSRLLPRSNRQFKKKNKNAIKKKPSGLPYAGFNMRRIIIRNYNFRKNGLGKLN